MSGLQQASAPEIPGRPKAACAIQYCLCLKRVQEREAQTRITAIPTSLSPARIKSAPQPTSEGVLKGVPPSWQALFPFHVEEGKKQKGDHRGWQSPGKQHPQCFSLYRWRRGPDVPGWLICLRAGGRGFLRLFTVCLFPYAEHKECSLLLS